MPCVFENKVINFVFGIVCRYVHRYNRANIYRTSHTSCCVAAPPSSFIAALNPCFAWIRWNLVSYQQFSEAPRWNKSQVKLKISIIHYTEDNLAETWKFSYPIESVTVFVREQSESTSEGYFVIYFSILWQDFPLIGFIIWNFKILNVFTSNIEMFNLSLGNSRSP